MTATLAMHNIWWAKHSCCLFQNRFCQLNAVNKRWCLYPKEDACSLNSPFFLTQLPAYFTLIPSPWHKVGTTLYIKEMSAPSCFEIIAYLGLIDLCLPMFLLWKSLWLRWVHSNEGLIVKASSYLGFTGLRRLCPNGLELKSGDLTAYLYTPCNKVCER